MVKEAHDYFESQTVKAMIVYYKNGNE
jgi:hypothetical protein